MINKTISMGMFALVSVIVLSACAGAAKPTATTTKPVVTIVQSTPTAVPVAKATLKPSVGPTVAKTAPSTSQTTVPAVAPQNLISVTLAAGKFKTLVTALNAAGLIDTLRSAGPFTVFAPTDEAFAKLPKGTLDELLKPANKQRLTDLLRNHVVVGRNMVADLAKLKSIKTTNGISINISMTGSIMSINGARIVAADISSSNGVIQAIDTVLMPPTK